MSVDSYYKKNMAAFDASMKKSIADSDAIFANQKQNVTNTYNSSIELSKQQYDEDLRANEVQKYINKREVAENNANLGLTDSGLNRTQMTAVQLSASNNAAKIERDRTNMVNALTIEMNTKLAEIENDRISAEASIRSGYEKQAMDAAVDSYEADVAAAQKSAEAAQKAANEANTALTTLIKDFSDNSYNKEAAAKKVKGYIDLYGADESTLDILLSNARLTGNEYAEYLTNGNLAQSWAKAQNEKYGLTGNLMTDPGKINMNVYGLSRVEKTDDTFNWFGGVDGNDVIKITTPDGISKEYKIKDLPKDVQEKLTSFKKGQSEYIDTSGWGL